MMVVVIILGIVWLYIVCCFLAIIEEEIKRWRKN